MTGPKVRESFLPVYYRVLSMLEDGRSFGEIARILNAEGVPTSRGRTWYPSSVRTIAMSKTARSLK